MNKNERQKTILPQTVLCMQNKEQAKEKSKQAS